MKARAHPVHSLPGRTRFRVPNRRGDAGFFAEVAHRLMQCAGVARVETNPLTSSVLVHHEGDLRELLARAAACGLGELVELELHSPPVARRLRHEVRALDHRIRDFTHGELDLSTLAFLALLAMAGVQLLRGQQPVVAVSLAWYASELLRRWEEPQPEPGPQAVSA
jgi:hypothetical protein